MKKYISTAGIFAIVAGTLVLTVGYFSHQTTNVLLTAGMLLITAGVVTYIQGVKHQGRY